MSRGLVRTIQFIFWCINALWIWSIWVVAGAVAAATYKWVMSTVEMLQGGYAVMVAAFILIFTVGFLIKLTWKYWSDRGTQNGFELIKWNGTFNNYEKAEAKNES